MSRRLARHSAVTHTINICSKRLLPYASYATQSTAYGTTRTRWLISSTLTMPGKKQEAAGLPQPVPD